MVMLVPLKIDATANKLLGFPLLGKSLAETSRTKTGHELVEGSLEVKLLSDNMDR